MLDPGLEQHLVPTQMASTGRPPATRRRSSAARRTAASPAMQAAYAPDPGHHQAVGGQRGVAVAVTLDVAPVRASARSAERRLPEP